jgi:hypothetical protein
MSLQIEESNGLALWFMVGSERRSGLIPSEIKGENTKMRKIEKTSCELEEWNGGGCECLGRRNRKEVCLLS